MCFKIVKKCFCWGYLFTYLGGLWFCFVFSFWLFFFFLPSSFRVYLLGGIKMFFFYYLFLDIFTYFRCVDYSSNPSSQPHPYFCKNIFFFTYLFIGSSYMPMTPTSTLEDEQMGSGDIIILQLAPPPSPPSSLPLPTEGEGGGEREGEREGEGEKSLNILTPKLWAKRQRERFVLLLFSFLFFSFLFFSFLFFSFLSFFLFFFLFFFLSFLWMRGIVGLLTML